MLNHYFEFSGNLSLLLIPGEFGWVTAVTQLTVLSQSANVG